MAEGDERHRRIDPAGLYLHGEIDREILADEIALKCRASGIGQRIALARRAIAGDRAGDFQPRIGVGENPAGAAGAFDPLIVIAGEGCDIDGLGGVHPR